jgi:hypothetical protein
VTELARHLNGRGLVRHYNAIGPEERFRLAIEARSRGDDRELRRLAESVPMRLFWISDPAYMERCAASRDIATALALELPPLAVALRVLRATREAFAERIAVGIGHEVHKEFGSPDFGLERTIASSREGIAERFAGEDAAVLSRGAAVLEAFREVCGEMGLLPETVLHAHLGPMVDQLALEEFDGAEPHKHARGEWGELMQRLWRERARQ